MAEKKVNRAVDELAEEMELELLRIDPAEVYDPAIIGLVERAGGESFLLYDRNKVIRQTVEHEGMSYEDAVEWHTFNTFDAWLGEGTPAFLTWSVTAE